MKILQVTNLYSPNHGGGAEAPYQLSRNLAKHGHKVTVYCSDYKMTRDYYESPIVTWAFPTKLAIANLHITPSMLKYDFKDFDIIHLHNARTFQNIVASYYAVKHNIPYVLQAHGGILPIFQKRGLKRVFDFVFNNRILRNAKVVIAGNEAEVAEYKTAGVPNHKIVIIPPFYDTTEYDNLPPRMKLPYHVIMFMGRIHEIKGLEFLVDSFFRLHRQRDDVVLQIVGPDGGYQTTLLQQIHLLGLDKSIQFTGLLRGKEKLQALVNADILVQPSIYERGAGSPFEAVLAGTPIIVTSGTGAGNMVEQANAGYTIKHGDIDGLVHKMNYILTNPDEATPQTLQGANYIREKLSWKVGLKQYENLYDAVRVK